MPKAAVRDIDELSEEVRLAVRRFFRRTHAPLILYRRLTTLVFALNLVPRMR